VATSASAQVLCNGSDGSAGPDGTSGLTGAAGAKGAPGAAGVRGAIGPIGGKGRRRLPSGPLACKVRSEIRVRRARRDSRARQVPSAREDLSAPSGLSPPSPVSSSDLRDRKARWGPAGTTGQQNTWTQGAVNWTCPLPARRTVAQCGLNPPFNTGAGDVILNLDAMAIMAATGTGASCSSSSWSATTRAFPPRATCRATWRARDLYRRRAPT